MKRRNLKRSLGRVQRLEDRRLLAADLSVIELAPVEALEVETCQVAELETAGDVEDQLETLDLDSTEVQDELQIDVDADIAEQVESSVHDLGDPVDGTDGFFGSIDAESSSQAFTFSPTEGGMIDVVVASSFGESETRLEVTNSNGDVVASTMTEELSGFLTLSFETEAGDSYELTVESEEGAEGYFQVTVEHSEIPEPVDLHADSIGEDSTTLEFVDGSSELTGELELASDVDTFRFTADSNGKASLSLAELNADNATELKVQVLDANGELITLGITNEMVGISFDVQGESEYFIAVSAGEDQTGSYQLGLTLEADVVDVDTTDAEAVVDEAAEESVEELDDGVVDEAAGVDETAEIAEVSEDETDEVVNEEVVADPVVETETNEADEMCDDETVVVDSESETVVESEGEIPVEIIGVVDEATEASGFEDVPESFEPTETVVDSESGDDESEVAVVDDVVEIDLPVDDFTDDATPTDVEPVDEMIDEEMEICFSDLDGEIDLVDSFFAEFDPASVFTVNDRYQLRRMM